MPTLSGISYQHLVEGSGTAAVSQDGSAQETYLVDWADAQNFVHALVGTWVSIGEGVVLRFTPPENHHDWTNLYCKECQIEGFGEHSIGGDGLLDWEKAKITATYTALAFNPSDPNVDDLMEESMELGTKVVTIPARATKSSPGNVVIDAPVIKIVPTATLTLTLRDMPNPPGGDFARVYSLTGKVNSATWRGAAAETLLFLGMSATRRTTTQGVQGWTMQFKFKHDPNGWNKVYNNAGQLVTVVAVTGGASPYETADFGSLLAGYTS